MTPKLAPKNAKYVWKCMITERLVNGWEAIVGLQKSEARKLGPGRKPEIDASRKLDGLIGTTVRMN